ncbi:MAG: hypothetical protein HY000_39880 [Planctomycetes bacterium]|nr:hypothetical protein [Planctomycetota bacterium]
MSGHCSPFNLVEDNLCEANAMSGTELCEGENNTVRNNTCINNSQGTPGRWSGILPCVDLPRSRLGRD